MPKRINNKPSKLFLGIDPGLSGAVVVLSTSGEYVDSLRFNKATDKDIATFFSIYAGSWTYLEKVGSTPKMATRSAFTFGRGYGKLEMACIACGLRYDYITPTTWRKEVGLTTKKGGLDDKAKKARKKDNRARVEETYPNLPIRLTEDLVDAILIAEACRRKHSGTK